MSRILLLISLLLAVILGPAAAQDGKPSAGKPARVTLQLNWFPEAEHGGYYAALVHGFYREAGLDVEILPGGVDVPVLQMVATGRVMFGVDNADQVLIARAQGAPLVALTAPLQESPRCIIVHEASGIQDFGDIKGITLGMSSQAAFAEWLKAKYPLRDVKVVPYPGNVSQFLVDPNYACQGYNISEPFVARQKGAKPRVLMVSRTGFNPYTSMIIASEDTLKQNEDLTRRFVEASNRGWAKYLESPGEANAYINKLNPQMDMDILAYGAKELNGMVLDETTRKHGIGHMTPERWTLLVSQLEEIGTIKKGSVKAESAYTLNFLSPAKPTK